MNILPFVEFKAGKKEALEWQNKEIRGVVDLQWGKIIKKKQADKKDSEGR